MEELKEAIIVGALTVAAYKMSPLVNTPAIKAELAKANELFDTMLGTYALLYSFGLEV